MNTVMQASSAGFSTRKQQAYRRYAHGEASLGDTLRAVEAERPKTAMPAELLVAFIVTLLIVGLFAPQANRRS